MKKIIIAFIFIFAIPTHLSAEIYKCTDENGKVSFKTSPGPEGFSKSEGCMLLPGSIPEDDKKKSHDIPAIADGSDKDIQGSPAWYKGGTLHQATVKSWLESSYQNRLATAGDWFLSITKSHNQTLKKKMDKIRDSNLDLYLATLKQAAIQFEICVSETASIQAKDRIIFRPTDKIAEVAAMCYNVMYRAKK
jgi:hypothetical protein